MLLRQEIIRTLYRLGPEALGQAVFRDLELEDSEKQALLSSICSGHHLMILGPPGSGKTSVANNLWAV
ncbi:MAG: ATP-binding protein, partial [Dehalococcoidia bacterium]|nr:ATP-binding protein [Dehalococcoidia bacterium]